jgi:general secretion pathway protein K
MISLPGQKGIVLISVLWIMAGLTLMVASSLVGVRTDIQLTSNHVRLAQARSLAEAGVYWAIHALLTPRHSVQPGLPAGAVNMVWGDARVTIKIENEAGKIDVNTADVRLVERALVRAGVDEKSARFLAALRPARPAADAANEVEGQPRSAFKSVEEFTSQPGIPRASVQRMLPWFTVYGGHSGINPWAASKDTLLAIPGTDEKQVDDYLEQRARSPLQAPGPDFNKRYISDRLSSVYTIIARTSMGGISSTVGTIVKLSAVPSQAYEILQWRSSPVFEAG